jgi:hypothetical protein
MNWQENDNHLYQKLHMSELTSDVLGSSGILLKYNGTITTEVVDSLLTVALHRLERIEKDITVRKKVYSILMECSQNLCLHIDRTSQSKKTDTSVVCLSLESDEQGYRIVSSNYISNDHVDSLLGALEEINNQKNQHSLKVLYNRVMTNNRYSEKGGGGLGLIDVARKSTGKLNYSFDKFDNDYSFFTLRVIIKK